MNGPELEWNEKQKKGGLKSAFRELTPGKLFAFCVLFGAAWCVLYYFFNPNAGFEKLFFRSGEDMFMDFFNSVRDAAQFARVYTERRVIYPPLANLLFLIFSRFLPASYTDTAFAERLRWREVPAAYLLIFLYSAAMLLALYVLLRDSARTRGTFEVLFPLAAVFSFPAVYAVERGNIILLSAILTLFFAATYQSENRMHRELGLICLAAAFGLKLYPALFGWVLIADKRYREAARCAGYGVLFLLIPSFFFGGPMCLLTMVQNVLRFSSVQDPAVPSNFTTYTAWVLGVPAKALSRVFYLWCAVCLAAFLLSPFVFREKRWKCFLMGAVLILTVPSLTSPYSATFLLIPLLLLAKTPEKHTASDWVYLIWAILPFVPIPNLTKYSANMITVYVATGVLSVYLCAEILIGFFGGLLQKRAGAPAAAET